ncbi:hypothetical protein ThrDRAFT_02729 [Frankia casuarinae]|uniref:hypothetical protein n=2 Tax=Frankiaceae TaxID=74712 RepID=UPI0003CFC567|nr:MULTISPECIES: hypothetical protein [Frankia]ESZ99768.1 hypothetical protein CcI6DRAFT_04814 [Frankia sp. CcI6]EYT91606.1 hypothetical protein ThrDRAFT_02729 [Frankia casuarinae]KDA41170.1 hypothetical protein BMG523Draft_04002 [Frankia sp. BMG5.23]KEZ34943.1 Sigma-70 region 2-containing protein [Frankia sp. CeD]OAA22675.1 Sigma-70 region 2-containing protein [Frankia casuarinae]
MAAGVYEAGCDTFVRCARAPGDQRALAGRRAGRREPLFPLFGALRLTVGVQEQAPTDGAATMLDLEEQRGHTKAVGQQAVRVWSAGCGPPTCSHRLAACQLPPPRQLMVDPYLAEEAVQEAFVMAADRWPRDGVPINPHAWLITTALTTGVVSSSGAASAT